MLIIGVMKRKALLKAGRYAIAGVFVLSAVDGQSAVTKQAVGYLEAINEI